MRELLLVLNLKLYTFLKGLVRSDWQSILRNSASFLIFGGFALATFFIARTVTAYLIETADIGLFLFHRFLSMILYVFFVTVNIGNIIVCYATLYRSEEVQFLISVPISHAKIFLIRFVDNFFYSSSTLALIGTSALLGYGSYFGVPWYFYLFVTLFVFLPFMVIAGVMAVVTLMGLIKVASKIGVRLLLTGIVIIYLSAVYLYFQVTNPVQLVTEVMKHYPDVNAYFGYLDPPLIQYLPNHWVSEFLYWFVNGNLERAIPYFFFLFFTMLGLVALAGLLARKYYYRTWLTASDAQAMKASRSPSTFRFGFLNFGRTSSVQKWIFGRNPQTSALFKRDFWLFFRDPGQWLHFLLMVLLMLIFLTSIGSIELRLVLPLMRAVAYLVIFMFNGFLVASISLRFVFPAMSLEGESFWAVRSSPLDLRRLYFHKLGYAFLMTFIAVEILVVGSIPFLAGDMFLVAIGAICGGMVALSMTSLHLGAGTYFVMFKEKNPIRVASSYGASITFLMSILYLGLIVLTLIVPLHNYYQAELMSQPGAAAGFYIPIGIIVMMSAMITLISTRVGLKSIRADY